MPLTKSELLIPRVLCIGGKDGEPNDTSGNYITGDILTEIEIETFGKRKGYSSNGEFIPSADIKDFPHLFKPLPWWYGRTESELPKYVKEIKSGKVHEASWYYFREKGVTLWSVIIQPNDIPYNPDGFQPASFSDYQEYQKQNQ